MSVFVLDTDHLTLYYHGDSIVVQRVDSRSPAELAISVLTVDEQLTGWYTLTRQARRPEDVARAYARLGEAVVRLGRWRILPYTEGAMRGSLDSRLSGSTFGSWTCGLPPLRWRIKPWS
jgi:tRNA(fMet)-specific endonuclease VapC